jgi:hypothetical protein
MSKYRGKTNIQLVSDYLSGTRPFIQVGYSAATKKRKVGERWKDNNGVTWEQREGYKTRINEQASIIREASKQICSCGQEIQFAGRLDELFYRKTGKCFDCVIKEETEYRILGVFSLYERYKLISNYYGFIIDMKSKIEESIRYFEKDEGKSLDILCNSEGFIEKFSGLNTTELMKSAKKDLKEVDKTIALVTKDLKEAKQLFEEGLKKAKESSTKSL